MYDSGKVEDRRNAVELEKFLGFPGEIGADSDNDSLDVDEIMLDVKNPITIEALKKCEDEFRDLICSINVRDINELNLGQVRAIVNNAIVLACILEDTIKDDVYSGNKS